MRVQVIEESGFAPALLGLGLSHGVTSGMEMYQFRISERVRIPTFERMKTVASKLHKLDHGHNKFLESIQVWLDVTAPRYWWQQMDTYRIGVTKQSESTMHTLMKHEITEEMFEGWVHPMVMDVLEQFRRDGDFENLKRHLPESFLQRRIICTNYKALRHIILQRRTHKLIEWTVFCEGVLAGVKHPELLPAYKE